MASNFYFNNFGSSQEQTLWEDLIIESFKIYGHDVYYLPRTLTNYDELYGADDVSKFENAYLVEMYIKSINGFTGDRTFMTNLGLQIRDQIVFSVARKTFDAEVGKYTEQFRPNEGDIIWFPINQRPFQIKYVEKYDLFYQLGSLYTWELTCEVFEYAGEEINTGIPEIDIIQDKLDTNVLSWGLKDEDDYYLLTEDGEYLIIEESVIGELPGDDSTPLNDEFDGFIDFTHQDPFSEGYFSNTG